MDCVSVSVYVIVCGWGGCVLVGTREMAWHVTMSMIGSIGCDGCR